MGCAQGSEAGRERAYEAESAGRTRRSQVAAAPQPQPRAAAQSGGGGGGGSAAWAGGAAPASAAAAPGRAASAAAPPVVQSVLKLKTSSRTNQYKLVSSKPIGKGFQSKVRLCGDRCLVRAHVS